jgi:hypothetical protein
MAVPVWLPGTLYQPGDLVKPTSSGTVTPPAIDNPGFEDGPTDGLPPADWTVLAESNGAIDAKDDAPTFAGSWAMQIFANENSDCRVRSDTATPCVPGDVVTYRAYCQWVSGDDPRFSWLQLSIRWFTSGMVELAPTIAYTLGTDAANGQGAQTVWAQRSVQGVAPAEAAFCSLQFDATTDDSNVGTWRVDACTIDFAAQAAPNPFIFRAVQAASGFSGSSEPTWPTVLGNTVVDNEVTWEAVNANTVTWEASRILVSGALEPDWPLVVNGSVLDNTISWSLDSRRVTDARVPSSSVAVLIASSKVFAGNDDIINFSATVNPLDWSTRQDAGYIGFGLQKGGGNPVTALGLYRGNLAAFNSEGCQLWQLDEDPAGIAYLDAIPVACTFPKSVQPVGDDLAFLSNLGIRSLGLVGAAVNLQGGYFGQQVDPLVKDLLAAATAAGYDPLGLYWPARGQYWLFFGAEALVLTISAGPGEKVLRSWSRYVFPSEISDWTIQGTDLVLRSGDLVWIVDPDELLDDAHEPWIDFRTASLYGVDGYALGATSLTVGTHTFPNGTPVHLYGNAAADFGDNAANGDADAYELELDVAVTAAAGDVVMLSFAAEGPFTAASGGGAGSSLVLLAGATGLERFTKAGTVLRINRSGGVDWNYLAEDVEEGALALPLLYPLENAVVAIRVYPRGAMLQNSLDNMVAYVPIEIAADVDADTTIALLDALPCDLDDEPAITCAYQLNAVAGGQSTTAITLAAPTAFATTGGATPDTGFYFRPVLVGAALELTAGRPFEGVIQWPYLDFKAPSLDKEMIGFDLVIRGVAQLMVGYNQRELPYDVAGQWTAPYEVDGDTLPAEMVPYSVTGPTLSLRLVFAANQSWEWFSANLHVKDLAR